MQRAKAFFYVSLGVLALAVAFHLTAGLSQSGPAGTAVKSGISMPASGGPVASALDPSGMIWAFEHAANNPAGPLAPPKAGPISSVLVTAANDVEILTAIVVYEDGDFFEYSAGRWQFYGNLFSAPTTSESPTWGRIKAERR